MIKQKSPKMKTLRFFLWSFVLICLFSLSVIWLNYFQFKNTSEENSYKLSKLIAVDIKTRYESMNKFVNAVDPFVTETMKSILTSMEVKIKEMGTIDNFSLNELKKQYNITNIYVINEKGIIQYSTDPREIGLDTKNLYKDRSDMDWDKIFKQVQQNKEIFIDRFSKSELYPYDFTKWAYKGIGYIDNLGLVVLEISISLEDIKEESVVDLMGSFKDLDKINENIVDLSFKNIPPNKSNEKNYFKESQVKKGNKIYTKINAKNLTKDTTQIIIVTKFDSIEQDIKNAFYNSLIASIFIVFFTIIISILFYHRFSIPINYQYKEMIEKVIKELNEFKK